MESHLFHRRQVKDVKCRERLGTFYAFAAQKPTTTFLILEQTK